MIDTAEKQLLPNGFSRRQIAACITPRLQELILLPTEKCNFRCTYCYEDFELGRMKEPTILGIEAFLRRRVPELRQLRFSWFGGEPLVAKDIVLRLSRFAKTLCDTNGVTFIGGLTTNAYMLDRVLAMQLLDCNQNFFQITLDGWKDVHDMTRRRADGRGTFDVIWQNLIDLSSLDRDFEVALRIHLSPAKLTSAERLVAEIARQFKGDPRFRLDFQHLRDMGGVGGKTIATPYTQADMPALSSHLMSIFKDAGGTDDSSAATLSRDWENAGESAGSRRSSEFDFSGPYICYAARPNSLLIRSNGRIAKCTVALSDDRNDLGYIGSDGHLVLNNDKLAPWIRGLGSLSQRETGCPMDGMPRASTPRKVVPIVSAINT